MRLRRIAVTAVAFSTVAGCAASPPPSPSGAASHWPHEPAGLRLLTDWGFDQAPPLRDDVPIAGSPGWSVVYGMPPDPAHGSVALVADAHAPLSPPNVYDVVYPQGMVEGFAPTTVYYPRSAFGILQRLRRHVWPDREGLASPEAYVGLWWKPSSPFDFG